MSEQASNRVYLTVPFMEKDRAKEAAKEAGFRIYWDKKNTQWFASANEDLSPLSRWLPKGQGRDDPGPDPVIEFSDALKDAGLLVKDTPVMDGVLRRVAVVDAPSGNLDGAYLGHLDGHPAGFIQNHKTGLKTNWKASHRPRSVAVADTETDKNKPTETLTPIEQSDKFSGLMEKLDVPKAHPYASNKNITLDPAIRVTSGNQLAIPVYSQPVSRGGRIVGIQYISEAGAKRFARGTRKKGALFIVGEADDPQTILIAEGYATAQTLHEATDFPAAVAFDAGNLAAVTQTLRTTYPDVRLVLCADDDRSKTVNVGKSAADAIEQTADVIVITPEFGKSPGTDFNDLAAESGISEVTRQINNELESNGVGSPKNG